MFHPEGPTFLELMRQAMSSTDHGYDLIAPKFDRTPFRTKDELLAIVAAQLEPCDDGIDLCCGTGAGIRMLRPLCRKRVVGVDRSRGMLAEAERRTAYAPGTARIELVRGDVLELPFESEFDLAVSFGAFGHILRDDQPAFARQVAKCLRPGGQFVFITQTMPSVASRQWWLSRGFNAAMHARKLVKKPAFHMYYLNFLVSRAREVLEPAGLRLQVWRGVFPPPFDSFELAIARKADR